jgi:hypothetical protein
MDTNLDKWIRPRHLCKAPGHGHYWNKGPCEVEPRPRHLCKPPQALGITEIRASVRWSQGGLIPVMPHGRGHLHSINVITHLFCDLWGFQLPEVRKEKNKNCQIHICGFHCVAKHIIRWLNICTLFLVYSQIWLNLHTDDCHFFLQTEIPLKEKHWLTSIIWRFYNCTPSNCTFYIDALQQLGPSCWLHTQQGPCLLQSRKGQNLQLQKCSDVQEERKKGKIRGCRG